MYILIIIILYSNPFIDHIWYDDLEACELARKAVIQQVSKMGHAERISASCTKVAVLPKVAPKGEL